MPIAVEPVASRSSKARAQHTIRPGGTKKRMATAAEAEATPLDRRASQRGQVESNVLVSDSQASSQQFAGDGEITCAFLEFPNLFQALSFFSDPVDFSSIVKGHFCVELLRWKPSAMQRFVQKRAIVSTGNDPITSEENMWIQEREGSRVHLVELRGVFHADLDGDARVLALLPRGAPYDAVLAVR